MRVSIVTIGSTNHSEWSVGSDTIKIGGKDHLNYFLESKDKKVLQKIKLGGNLKDYPNDNQFNTEMISSSGVNTDGEISVQEMTIPFGKVFVNPKNMNPYVAGLHESNRDRLIILLLGTDYTYVRSNINHSIGEVICTFHTSTSIACALRVSEARLEDERARVLANLDEGKKPGDINFLMVDTFKDGEFNHFRINISADMANDEHMVVKSTIKNKELIKRLSSIDSKFTNKKVGRRFVRFTPNIITSYFVFSSKMSEEDMGSFIDRHYISDALDSNIPFLSYRVNTDEKGYVINDDELKSVIEDMKSRKVKAFTLIGCKIAKDTFESVKPLYIFSLDETEDVTNPNDVKTIKCIKSN